MPTKYACVCCALPSKLVKHLAATAPDDDRDHLTGQVAHTQALRGQRAGHRARPTATAVPAQKPLHRQVFDAEGHTFLPGKLLRDEDDALVADAAANQAYDNIGIALSFFAEVLGRNSVDGRGRRIDASVHYGFRFVNAMWTGEQMLVGDGDGKRVTGLAGSLGLIAHEFSHGVSQHLVRGGLGVVQVPGAPPMLKGEAGALNESFSDVCASMVKQWHAKQTVEAADWLLGEDVLAPSVGKAIRSLKDPGNTHHTWVQDDQIKDARQFTPAMDAHTGSGVANHAFYLAALQLGGHAWETLGAVWYQAFDTLRSRATFLDAAHATVNAAATLHGSRSATHKAVKAAWRSVNVMA